MYKAAPTYRTSLFHREEGLKSLSQEASTLGLPPGVVPYGRLYSDAADVGIKMLSEEGKESSWYLHQTDKDASGDDIAGWRFKPTNETVLANPKTVAWEVLIVND